MIILSMPLYLPEIPINMNWSVVIIGGVMALSGIYYAIFFSKKEDIDGDGHHGDHMQMQLLRKR